MIAGRDNSIPVVTKNLLIINALFFLTKWILGKRGINLDVLFAAFYPDSIWFRPWQIITHMFMHADITHIFFNMFSLWMFGSAVEQVIGTKNFLKLYFIAGFGSFLLYNLFHYFEVQHLLGIISQQGITLDQIKNSTYNHVLFKQTAESVQLFSIYNIPMLGASGAIFGVLVAFGMLFPDAKLMLLFPPIPIKAKYFIPFIMAYELYLQFSHNPNDNVAHLAHIGGGIFGYFFIKWWKRKTTSYFSF